MTLKIRQIAMVTSKIAKNRFHLTIIFTLQFDLKNRQISQFGDKMGSVLYQNDPGNVENRTSGKSSVNCQIIRESLLTFQLNSADHTSI